MFGDRFPEMPRKRGAGMKERKRKEGGTKRGRERGKEGETEGESEGE